MEPTVIYVIHHEITDPIMINNVVEMLLIPNQCGIMMARKAGNDTGRCCVMQLVGALNAENKNSDHVMWS